MANTANHSCIPQNQSKYGLAMQFQEKYILKWNTLSNSFMQKRILPWIESGVNGKYCFWKYIFSLSWDRLKLQKNIDNDINIGVLLRCEAGGILSGIQSIIKHQQIIGIKGIQLGNHNWHAVSSGGQCWNFLVNTMWTMWKLMNKDNVMRPPYWLLITSPKDQFLIVWVWHPLMDASPYNWYTN